MLPEYLSPSKTPGQLRKRSKVEGLALLNAKASFKEIIRKVWFGRRARGGSARPTGQMTGQPGGGRRAAASFRAPWVTGLNFKGNALKTRDRNLGKCHQDPGEGSRKTLKEDTVKVSVGSLDCDKISCLYQNVMLRL